MITKMNEVQEYLQKLLKQEENRSDILGNYTLTVTPHTKSERINASTLEFNVEVCDNEDETKVLEYVNCSLVVVEKLIANQKTQREFTTVCSIVINDKTKDVIWNKMSRNSTTQAAEYICGFIISNINYIRKGHSVQNIKDYVAKLVSSLDENTGEAEN